MNQRETGDLGQGSVGKLLLRLALPTITAQLVNALYNMVDRIYIGHIPVVGRTALTGVGVCMSLIMIISAFAALTAMGGATRASIFLGRGDRAGAEKILGTDLLYTIRRRKASQSRWDRASKICPSGSPAGRRRHGRRPWRG